MAGLKTIKTKIRSIEKTETVTKAMEAVSAAKMRKAQLRALAGRAYARAAVSILARVSGSRVLANHSLTRGASSAPALKAARPSFTVAPDGTARSLYIVITSDKGLAGALNSAVLRAVAADIASLGLEKHQISIIAVGRKAQDYFVTRGYTVEVYHPNTDSLTEEILSQVLLEAQSRFVGGAVDMVKIAYQNFVSTLEQRPTLRMLFPLTLEELQMVVEDITPTRGAFAEEAKPANPGVYTIEPSEEEVLNVILPKLASIFLYHVLLEAQASEHSARMVAMKSASDKAAELEHSLTLAYNKARQAAITREVSEIIGGMEAVNA